MDKQEQYLQWVINDIKKNTYLTLHPTKIIFGGIWGAYPKHFYDPPTPEASIFKSLSKNLSLHYGLTEDELWIIVDELYPWIVDTLLADYPRIR